MSVYMWEQLTPLQVITAKGLGGERGIFLRGDVLRAFKGDCAAAVLMTQYVYWSQSEYASKNDGWFYLTTQKVIQELGITAAVQKRIRPLLQELGLIEWERRGMPAKNYYRVALDTYAEFVAKNGYQLVEIVPSSGADSYQQEGRIATNIVNREVRTNSLDTIVSGNRPARGRNAKINIMGEKFDDFLKWIVETYPINGFGIKATEAQARKMAKKLGDVLPSATEDERRQKRLDIQEFIRAVKNLRAEVDAGNYETKYVPKFDNFAGLGVLYGKEPSYRAWAAKQIVEPKKKQFVV